MQGHLFEGSREDWLALRDTKIGASELATVLGVNPYESIGALVKRKITRTRKPDSRAMATGRRLEPSLLDACSALISPVSRRGECRYTDDLIVTFDGLLAGDVPIEIKTTDARNHARWLEHGPPPWYQIQVQAQLWMAQVPEGMLACAFISGDEISDIRFVRIQSDDAAIEQAVLKWRNIWRQANDSVRGA